MSIPSKHYTDNFTANHIEGNVYAITGGGSGFGKELAIEIVKMGGKVVITGRTEAKLAGTVKAIEDLGKGDSIAWMTGDVARFEDNQALVQLAADKFGKLDAFVANAGIMPLAGFDNYKNALPAWEQCIDINLKGNLYGMCAAYDQFMAQGYGHFVTISSIHGNFATAGSGVYAATKIGVRYLAQSLRNECHGKIKVSVISPTGVPATDLFSTVISGVSGGGIMSNGAEYMAKTKEAAAGGHPEYLDNDDVRYLSITPEELVWGILFTLNQPRGVNMGELTVRATNEPYFV